MTHPRHVQSAGVECRQAPVRPRVRALARAPGRTPMRPRAGGTAGNPPTPRAFPDRPQAPVAGRVPLPATGASDSRSEGSRGLSNPVGIHLNFALGLSNEVGPPHRLDALEGGVHLPLQETAHDRRQLLPPLPPRRFLRVLLPELAVEDPHPVGVEDLAEVAHAAPDLLPEPRLAVLHEVGVFLKRQAPRNTSAWRSRMVARKNRLRLATAYGASFSDVTGPSTNCPNWARNCFVLARASASVAASPAAKRRSCANSDPRPSSRLAAVSKRA